MIGKAARWVGRSLKSTFNVFAWLGTKPLKDSTGTITQLSKPLFEKSTYANQRETFVQAQQRFNLSDLDLLKKSLMLTRQIRAYAALLFLLTIYLLYLLFRLDLFLVLVMLGIIALMLCKLFQAHYRRFCIRERSLDKGFKLWWQSIWRRNNE